MNPAGSPDLRITAGEWIAIPLLWLVLAVLVNPVGEFPLNDDWAYATAVRGLVEEGRLELTDWGAMSLVAHILWGALATLPFGFSFTALRLGTVVLGALGLLACLGLFREAGLSRRTARAATLLVAANPIYFLHAYTFMTDVPYFAATIGALLFWLRWQRTRAGRDLLVLLLLLALSTLIRQVTVGIGFGLAIATLVRRGRGARAILESLGTAAFPVVVLAAYNAVAAATMGVPQSYAVAALHLKIAFFEFLGDPGPVIQRYGPFVARRVAATILYLGLFSLPLAVMRAPALRRRPDRGAPPALALFAALAIGAAALAAALAYDAIYPAFGLVPNPFPANTVTGLTLGPPTLSDSLLVRTAHVPPGPRALRIALTAAAAAGAGFLLAHVLAELLRLARWLLLRSPRGREPDRRQATVATLALAASGLYILPFWLATIFFDRYVLLAVPLALLALGRGRWRDEPRADRPDRAGVWRRGLGGLLLALLLGWAVAGTHDYLAWNRAAWAVADELVRERGVARDDIDAGFAFNMWHRYPAFPTEPGRPVWWCPGTGRFVLTFGPVPGHRAVETRPFGRWLPGGPDRLWLLERTP